MILRKDELETLKILIDYGKKYGEEENGRILITHPSRILDQNTKYSASNAIHLIRRVVKELAEMNMVYISKGADVSYCYSAVGLLKVPINIEEQIEDAIEQGKLKIVDKRKRGYRY